MNRFFSATFLLLVMNASAYASEYAEILPSGGVINWTKAVVEADGFGIAPEGKGALSPMLACRAATVDAQRNLLESAQGARVTAETTISNYTLTSDRIKSTVEGVVKQAKVISREPDPSGNVCRVKLRARLEGDIAEDIYSANLDSISRFKIDLESFLHSVSFNLISSAQAASEPVSWMERIESRINSIEQKLFSSASTNTTASDVIEPTGLVIDARGSRFLPSLSPRIRELKGGVLYPLANSITRAANSGRLVSLFATDVDFALKHPRVGDRPLLVKALKTYGDTRTDIVLGPQNSKSTVELISSDSFGDAGVIIVLD